MLLFFTLAKKETKTSGLAVFGNCSETSFNSFSYVRKTEDSESVGSASCNSIDHLIWSKLLNKNCAVSYWYIKQNLSWVWTSCSKGIFFVRKYWCFCHISKHFTFLNLKIWILVVFRAVLAKGHRECVRAGAAGAGTRRSLGHHLLHLLILRLLVLCAPAEFEAQSSL